jgi:hypothetical protein
MIAAFVLPVFIAASPVITYRGVPRVVASIRLTKLVNGRPTEDVAGEISGDEGRVGCDAGREVMVSFIRGGDGAYLVDGPFVCPPADAARQPGPLWRRTLQIRAPPGTATGADLAVVRPRDDRDGWPRCEWVRETAECRGVPLDASGIVLFMDRDRVWWTVMTGATARTFQSSAWGRLVVVSGGSEIGAIAAALAHPVLPPPERSAALRLDTAGVPHAHVVPLAPVAVWIYGEENPPGAWLELRGPHAGPAYLPLEDVARAPATLPLWVTLDVDQTIAGAARGQSGDAASGAVVTLFRLVDPRSASPSPPTGPITSEKARVQPRRVFVAERVADGDGRFQFDGLGDAEYEIVAWHPRFGRAIAPVPRAGGDMTVRLESPGEVRGRVLSGGKPLASVDIVSLPDPQAYIQAADMTDIKGGDGQTGPDGRFVVSLAPGGGGEVRVGGGSHPIRRFPLPRAPVPVVDLGEIDLGAPIDVTIVLDQDPGCDLRATGPIGRVGLQVIGGSRIAPGLFRVTFPEEGTWEIHLSCGRNERPLAPGLVSVSQGNSGKELRFLVR